MDIHVLKFGGSSMIDSKAWKQVLEIIKNYEYPVAVVSATARTTRQLIEAGHLAASGKLDEAMGIAEEIKIRHADIVHQFLLENPSHKNALIEESCIQKLDQIINRLYTFLKYAAKQGELNAGMQDSIAAVGEQIVSYLLAQCGLALQLLTQHVDAKKLIKTDNSYGNAKPNTLLISQKIGSLETLMEDGFTPVIGGFYGEAPNNTITTLGLEGSDYSASLLGGALKAKSIEIWTDVSGVFTCDPHLIKNTKPIAELSYFDATEMAFFGAKVLHPSTLKSAQERNIPVRVKNLFKPEDDGTLIVRESKSPKQALAISLKDDMALLTISAYETVMEYNFLTRIFKHLESLRISTNAINITEASVTIAVTDSDYLDDFAADMVEIGSVNLSRNKALISIIGCQFSKANDLITNIFEPMTDTRLDMISFSNEKRILNVVVDESKLINTAQLIHSKLFE
ncbi:MAG: aspartate kinase [Balneolaceae bacterium]